MPVPDPNRRHGDLDADVLTLLIGEEITGAQYTQVNHDKVE